jgi:chemotaxis signal transduction protein
MQEDEIVDNTEKENENLIEEEDSYIEMMCLQIGQENMLIPVSEIEEVVRVQKLTRVPMAPNHLLGVCNVHGQVVCVIDPCVVMRLNAPSLEDTPSTRFVVLRHSGMNLALKVASVSALYRVQEHLVPNLEHGAKGFFRGEMEVEHKAYRVLHTHALFA